ncbi:hypothetical protein ABEF92_006369 [Exophiala dermatitidis]|uniref:DNA-directed RNA polymerase n=1 Tax=Exophiala dermatitidis (strain ATCC 34100 / CBS 525.76 / NIH/UT8656) TaxID=858893 RepID=H6C6C7_EXODN|nr:DNA-directed RNA polymerase [Exophiala dermatitidis NIH/UT8656]EHY59273.1 DNA-directed RNA polymerase [Exophiala dermatitidis NIH/UT8656]
MPRSPSTPLLVASLLTWLPLCVQAHMQLSWPYPLRSPLDPDVPYYEKDYSMTSPLLADGSDFSCKHYQKDYADSNVTKATYVAGGTYDMWVNGTATHDGGSCQLSLSYDDGVTFKVIKSIIGGCPLPRTYDFTIPEYAPASDTALFSWTWFNIVGNREMYQNCARVKIVSNPTQKYKRTPFKRASSLDDLPDIFTCNIGNNCQTIEGAEIVFPNPGDDVVYGTDAINAAAGPGYTISGSTATATATSGSAGTTATAASTGQSTSLATTTDSGIASATTTTTQPPFPLSNATTTTGSPTGTGFPDPTGPILTVTGSITYFTTSSSSVSSTDSVPTTTDSTGPILTVTGSITTFTSSSSAAATSSTNPDSSATVSTTTDISSTVPTTLITLTSSSSSSSPTTTTTTAESSGSATGSATSSAPSSSATASSCSPGSFECNSSTTFSQCVSTSSTATTWIYMGSVAAGMQCSNGQIIRENAGACTPSGSIFCNGENAFYMCDQGGLVDMGPVAAGTACRNGEIVFA